MATTLGRFGLASDSLTSVSVSSAYKVSDNEALLVYTEGGTDFADVFLVPDQEDLQKLVDGAGDGETLQAVLQPGTGDSTSQAVVTEVRTIAS